jgi:hypothetical protein
MRPQLQPVLESHLAAILMGELLRPREDLLRPREDLDDTYVDIVLDDLELDETDEYYASFELVREPASNAATTEFVRVRDTTHDHITTKRYPRESLDPDTLQTPRYSAPYELIDIEHPPIATPIEHPPIAAPLAAQFTAYSNAKFPLYSAPYERVDLQDYSHAFVKAAPSDWSAESTEVLSVPKTASRVIATIVVLVGALLLGLSIALYM